MTRTASWKVLAMAAACLAAGCMPDIPPPPDLGFVVSSAAVSGVLPDDTATLGLSDGDRIALRSVLSQARAASLRRVAVEVSGRVNEPRKSAMEAEIRQAFPTARTAFTPGSGASLVVIRGDQATPTSCLQPQPWFNDGLLPPGCASGLAFGRSLEDPRDLTIGRPLGLGAVGPLARDGLLAIDGKATGQSSEPVAQPGSSHDVQQPAR